MIKKALIIILLLILVPVALTWAFSQYPVSNTENNTNKSSKNSSGLFLNNEPSLDGISYLQEGHKFYIADSNSNRVNPSPYNDTESYTINNFDEIANNNIKNSYSFYSINKGKNIDINQGYEYFVDDSEIYAVYDDPKIGVRYYEN